MMKATALLLNYKRPDNLVKIIESLRNQNIKIYIYLWNNNSQDSNKYDVDLQINSSQNLMCSPRWILSSYSTTEYVFSLDDDLIPTDNSVICDCLNYAINYNCAIGYTGVKLNNACDYWSSSHIYPNPTNDQHVDIIKGRFLLCNKKYLYTINWINENKQSNYRIEDDIIVSSQLTNKIIPSLLYKRMLDLPQNNALMYQHNHKTSRTQATWKYFNNDSINTNTRR